MALISPLSLNKRWVKISAMGLDDISWNFEQTELKHSPITIVSCKMTHYEKGLKTLESEGTSVALSAKKAFHLAFCEAWERLVFYHFLQTPLSPAYAKKSSNGYAAGSDPGMALRLARSELIERFLLLTSWHEQKAWRPYRLRSYRTRLLQAVLTQKPWMIEWYDVEGGELGKLIIGLAIHQSIGAIICECTLYLSHESEQKILLGLLAKIAQFPLETFHESYRLEHIPDTVDPYYHHLFYLQGQNRRAFDWITSAPSWSQSELIIMSEQGHRIQTQTLCRPKNLPAVAVAYHPQWEELSWGRSSIKGKNKWPHPLA